MDPETGFEESRDNKDVDEENMCASIKFIDDDGDNDDDDDDDDDIDDYYDDDYDDDDDEDQQNYDYYFNSN